MKVAQITLTINGQERSLPADCTIRQMIGELGLSGQAVAVEVNREVVPRKQHEQVRLQAGDVVEVVSLVGGG